MTESADVDAMVSALGGAGQIEFSTDWETGKILVGIDGKYIATVQLRKVVCGKALMAALAERKS